MKYKNYYKCAKQLYKNEKSGHDFSHIKRVLKHVKKIIKVEGGNEFLLTVATLFHDVHRLLSNKQNRYVCAKESIEEVEKILTPFNIEPKNLKQILFLIENHENKDDPTITNLELKILQDADVLDAIGLIGLRRTKKYCKNKNIPRVNKNYSLNCKEYVPDIFPISTTHYVFRTMIPQGESMETAMGKKLAKTKLKVLFNFVNKNIKKYNLKTN